MKEVKSKKAKGKNWEFCGYVRQRGGNLHYFFLFTFAFCLSSAFLLSTVSAQDDPPDTAPPPLKLISKQERMSLEAQTDVKARTKLALELMQARLATSERLYSATDFDGMFRELGGFQGLLDNTLNFLLRSDKNSDKVLNNFKRFEIGLRRFSPRIETIRRELPLQYEEYMENLIKYVRNARARAIEPLFGDSVVPASKKPT